MPNPSYRETITVYNCIKAKDNGGAMDGWVPTVLYNCFFQSHVVQNAGDQTLSMSSSYTARIPADTGAKYLPYREWKELEDKEGYYTLSENDVIVKGEVIRNISTASHYSINNLLDEMKPDAFRVRAISDNTGARMGRHYRVSGV